MNRTRLISLPIVVLFVLLLAPIAGLHGCRGTPLSGPPTLRVGRDECAECGMIINEDRLSSALLIERGGYREHLLYDDIACMLDHEQHLPDQATVIQSFVHDHDSRAWIDAAAASYLYADRDRLRTPMGSGIAAFAPGAGAQRARDQFGGDVMDYQRLGPARRAWMRARYGKPDSP